MLALHTKTVAVHTADSGFVAPPSFEQKAAGPAAQLFYTGGHWRHPGNGALA